MKRLKKLGIKDLFLSRILTAKSYCNHDNIPYNEVIAMLQNDPKGKELLDTTKYQRAKQSLYEYADKGIVAYHLNRNSATQDYYAIDVYEYKEISTGSSISAVFICPLKNDGHRATYDDVEMLLINDTADNIAGYAKIDGLNSMGNGGDCYTSVPMMYEIFTDAMQHKGDNK